MSLSLLYPLCLFIPLLVSTPFCLRICLCLCLCMSLCLTLIRSRSPWKTFLYLASSLSSYLLVSVAVVGLYLFFQCMCLSLQIKQPFLEHCSLVTTYWFLEQILFIGYDSISIFLNTSHMISLLYWWGDVASKVPCIHASKCNIVNVVSDKAPVPLTSFFSLRIFLLNMVSVSKSFVIKNAEVVCLCRHIDTAQVCIDEIPSSSLYITLL